MSSTVSAGGDRPETASPLAGGGADPRFDPDAGEMARQLLGVPVQVAAVLERTAHGLRLLGAAGLSRESMAAAPADEDGTPAWPELAGLHLCRVPAGADRFLLLGSAAELPPTLVDRVTIAARWLGEVLALRARVRQLERAVQLMDAQTGTAGAAILAVTQHGAFWFNQLFARQFGAPATAEAGLRAVAARAHRLDAARLLSGEPIRPEIVEFDDGRLIEIACTALPDGPGHARAIGYTFRDVTERRLAERELRRERDFSAAILGSTGALVVVLDREGNLVSVNRACEVLSGWTFDELRSGRLWTDLLPPDEAQRIRAAFRRLVADDASFPVTGRNRWRLRDGSERLVAWSFTTIAGDDGRPAYIVGTGQDITDQARAEQERHDHLARERALRAEAEEARRRAAFLAEASRTLAGSLDYAVTLDRVAHLALPDYADWCIVDLVEDDGRIDRVAVAHVDAAKQPLADELHRDYPLDPSWPEGIVRVMRSGRPERFSPLPDSLLVAIGRTPRHLELLRGLGVCSAVCVPLVARGRLLGGITLMYGDSGRQYGPEDVPFAEDLGRRSAAAVDNARLYRAAQDAVRARDEFLSIASHELRTPMTSLRLAVQGMQRLAGRGPLPESVLETAVRQSARMSRLIDHLLDVSRIQAGRLDVHLEDVDLTALARELATGGATELARAGCAVTLRAEGPVVGRWDRARLEQVIVNLLSNAAKYGAGRPVEVRVEREGALARLAVSDHGIGIPADRLGSIFERFERAVSSEDFSGLGLGLYIVRRVLEALGGTVSVDSRPGEGSTFTIELPIGGPTPAPPGV